MLALIFLGKKRFKNINVSVSSVAKVAMEDRRAFWGGAPKQTSPRPPASSPRPQTAARASLRPSLLFRNSLRGCMAPREARQTDVWFCCLLVGDLGRAPKCPEPRFPPLALSAEAHQLAAPPLASRADPVPGHGAQTLNLLGWLHAGLGEQGLASPGRSVSPGRVSRAARPLAHDLCRFPRLGCLNPNMTLRKRQLLEE